jgi:hypothetical protein
MTLAAWLEIIKGVLAFPGEVLALVQMLRGTPAEQRQAIMARVMGEKAAAQETGRPV